MAIAVGVREDFDPKDSEAVTQFINENMGKVIPLSNGESVTFLKGDIRVKEDKAVLIYRYQLVMN